MGFHGAFGAFQSHGDTPRWMVYFMEKPNQNYLHGGELGVRPF
jgi:hypothetical protein